MNQPSTSGNGSKERSVSSDLLDASSDGVRLKKLIEHRAREIAMTVEDVKRKLPKLSSQQVPRHMRRRSVSHNVKRLPRRIRERAEKEANAKKTKRPSRRFRRRASNLLEEFGRRQRPGCDRWLETHVWHAKRFHMTSQWGYKLPLKPNDKGARAAHRATRDHCLIQDISYYACIELLGSQGKILEGLSKMCSQETGLTFAAKAYLPGTREGCTILYHANQYPYNAIGRVNFLWKPLRFNEILDNRTLWIWTHPACYTEIITQLGSVLEVDVASLLAEKSKMDIVVPAKNKKSSVDQSQADAGRKEVRFSVDCEVISNKKDNNFVHNTPIIENEMLTVKSKPVKTTDISPVKPSLKRKVPSHEDKTENCKKVKCENHVTIDESTVQFTVKSNVTLRSLKDSLVRFRLSGPKSHAVLQEVLQVSDIHQVQIEGEFWWQQYYNNGTTIEELQTVHKVWNSQRDCSSPACLTPGCVIALTVRDPRLIDLPKTKRNPVPSYESDSGAGVRASGNLFAEMSRGPIWEEAVRDGCAASQIPQKKINELRSQRSPFETGLNLGDKENRVPIMLVQRPGRNQTGYGSGWDIILPCKWAMAFWINFIYRGARVCGLDELHRASLDHEQPIFPDHFPDTNCSRQLAETQRKNLMEKHFRYPPNKRPNFQKLGVASPFAPPWLELVSEWNDKQCQQFYVLRNKKVLSALNDYLTGHTKETQSLIDVKLVDALVCVSVTCMFKGVPSEFASLCMPNEEDLFQLRHVNKPSGPIEPPQRKGIEKEKLKTKKAKEYVDVCPKVDGLLGQCQRKPLGYLEEGRFSFLNGQGVGLGFCAFTSLLKLGELCQRHKTKATVLVRGQSSFQYRFAVIKVVL